MHEELKKTHEELQMKHEELKKTHTYYGDFIYEEL